MKTWFWPVVVGLGLVGVSTVGLFTVMPVVLGALLVAFVGLSVRAIRARRPAPVPEARWWLSYPKIARLEHATGIFDLYTSLGAEGHDPHIAAACATCSEERSALEAGDHTHDRLYKSQNQIACGVCQGKVAHIDSCWHPVQKRTMTVRGPVCGLCDRSLSGSMEPPGAVRAPIAVPDSAKEFMESWTWDQDGSAIAAYQAGLISPEQIRDLGLTYERAVVVPVRPPYDLRVYRGGKLADCRHPLDRLSFRGIQGANFYICNDCEATLYFKDPGTGGLP